MAGARGAQWPAVNTDRTECVTFAFCWEVCAVLGQGRVCAWLGAAVLGALSSEERRVLERKLKKERKKEERKRLREAGVAMAQSSLARRSGAQLALDYLCG
ncbi:hypothetical protein CB1_000927002 [Camelus ferus]|nr:hypothetical protein CB1_000927002 [Camelus ferus]